MPRLAHLEERLRAPIYIDLAPLGRQMGVFPSANAGFPKDANLSGFGALRGSNFVTTVCPTVGNHVQKVSSRLNCRPCWNKQLDHPALVAQLDRASDS